MIKCQNRSNKGHLHCNVVLLVSYISALNRIMDIKKTKKKINSTLKKMHATSGHIIYIFIYICNCSLDMHNT